MNRLVKWKAGLLVGTALVGLAGSALAAGFFGNWPVAGTSPYTSTLPLTGNENVPLDTNLPNGQNPASEVASLLTIRKGKISNSTDTASFTATAAQVSNGGLITLSLDGAVSSAKTVTLPDATSIWNNIPNVVAGYQYILRFVNNGGTSSGAWTVAAGTGDTITGNAGVAVGQSRKYLVTVTSSLAVTFKDFGN